MNLPSPGAARVSAEPSILRQAGAPQGLTLSIAGFLPILSILSLSPAIPTILAHFRAVPHATLFVPLMVTAPALVVALLSPAAGWVADRLGRRRPLLWATFIYGFFGVAPLFLDNLLVIFISRLAVGLSEAFILVIVSTLFADYYSVDARRRWITVQGLLGPALGAFSLAGAGALAATSWSAVFLVYAGAFAIFFAMLIWCYEPDRSQLHNADAAVDADAAVAPSPVASTFPVALTLKFCGVTLFSSTIYYVFVVHGGLAFSQIGVTSAARIGAIMGVVSLAVLVGSLLFNFVSRRVSSAWLIAGFLIALGVGTGGIGLSKTANSMIVFAAIQELGAGMTVTSLVFWVSRLLPPEHRGRGFGFWTSAFFLGQFISPAVVNVISNFAGGLLPAFALMGLVSLCGAAAIILGSARLPSPA